MEKDLKKALIYGTVTVLLIAVYNQDIFGIKTTVENMFKKNDKK